MPSSQKQLRLHHMGLCPNRSSIHPGRINAKHSNFWDPLTNLIGSWPTATPDLCERGRLIVKSYQDRDDGARVGLWNAGVLQTIDTAVSLRKCSWILLPWKLQETFDDNNVMVKCSGLPTHIREAADLSLGLTTSYPDWGFSVVSLNSSRQLPWWYLT